MRNIPKKRQPFRHLAGKRAPGEDSARRQVLTEWRGLDWMELEKRQANTVQPAADLVQRVVSDLGLHRRQAEAEIVRVWNHLIDPNVTAHAQPVGLAKGTLFVQVDSSVWLSEIVRYHRQEILLRLQHSFGRDLIGKISFRIG